MLYNILVKSLGNPPKTINNKYVDKGDIFHSLQEMRPHDFFKETVGWNYWGEINTNQFPY